MLTKMFAVRHLFRHLFFVRFAHSTSQLKKMKENYMNKINFSAVLYLKILFQMTTPKGINKDEKIELKEMNKGDSNRLLAPERQDDARSIYECVSQMGKKTNLDCLTRHIAAGKSDVNYQDKKDRGITALYAAVMNNEVETVRLLMSAGASLEYRNKEGNTALHYVCSQICPDENLFKILFPQGKNVESIRISKSRKLSKVQTCGCHLRTFEQTWFDAATSTNCNGYNILDLILQEDNLNESKRKIVQYLIKETDMFYLLKLLRNTQRSQQNSPPEVGRPFESSDNNSINSPFRRLLKLYPEIISDLLDRCVVKMTGKVNYHFELLDDTYLLHTWPPQQEYYCKWLYQSTWEHIDVKEKKTRDAYTKQLSQIRNNHPIMLMLKHKRDDTSKDPGKKEVYRQLVDHPLVKALIKHKWLHIGRKFHILSLILYVIFLFTLTTFVIAIDTLYVRFPASDNITTTSNKTGCIQSTVCTTTYICDNSKDCNNTTCSYDTSSYNMTTASTTYDLTTCETYGNYPMINVLQIAAIFQASILILKEIYHVAMTFGLEYFKQFKNYIKLTAYGTAIPFLINLSECDNTAYRETWQWILGTIAIFLAWVDLLAYVEKLDWLGIYVSMLKRITKTFLRNIFPIVLILIVAFALAFLCVRKKQDEFKNIMVSFLSTSAMMAGEFGYEDLSEDHIVYIVVISHMISGIFLIIMTIIIMNLMVGVAVRDVQEVYMHAIEERSTLQIEHILELERICQAILNNLMSFRCTKKFAIWLKVKFIQQPNREVLAGQLKSREVPKYILNNDQSENLGQKLDELTYLLERRSL